VASFSYAPNRDGLRFLLDDVLPRVWSRQPDARLVLVGAGLDGPVSEDPRVSALGFVDDLGAVYRSVACVAVPLRQGGGTPLKFVEALAYGVPVVATPLAARGLAVRDGEHCLIADGADAFAARLLEVLGHGGGELGRRARELAVARYSVRALTALLAEAET
jgi:glycosyltransferase involved in cell wall biosynthesis